MVVEKRIIWVQVLMYMVFLFWSLSSLILIFYDNSWIFYARFGVFFLLLGLIYLYFRKGSKKLIGVNEQHVTNNKRILYFFMTAYVAQIVLVNFLNDQADLIYIITTIVLSLISAVGIYINALILKKDK